MIGGEDKLFRPVVEGVLAPERLLDGSVDLQFVMLLNEAMDIKAENQRRAYDAAKTQAAMNAKERGTARTRRR